MRASVIGRGREVGNEERAAIEARFTQLYRELFPALYGYLRFRVGDPQVAEDLTAQVFERALPRFMAVRPPERLRAWLFAIARNLLTDHYRRRRPTSALASVDLLAHLAVESPEGEALRRDDQRRLGSYLRDLDEREREIVGLKFFAGLSNRETAHLLGLSEANVAQIIHRTVVKLRRRFVAEEET
jgi:RNA polymerase sigma-70 factor (ECF subfamily)